MTDPGSGGGDIGDEDGPGGGIGPGTGGSGAGGGGTGGGGSPGMATVLSRTITLPVAGVIDVDGAARMGFGSVPLAWKFELWIDGTLVWAPSGTYPGDVVPIGGTLYCAAGDRVVLLKWAGAVGVTLKDRFLKIRGFNNISG